MWPCGVEIHWHGAAGGTEMATAAARADGGSGVGCGSACKDTMLYIRIVALCSLSPEAVCTSHICILYARVCVSVDMCSTSPC